MDFRHLSTSRLIGEMTALEAQLAELYGQGKDRIAARVNREYTHIEREYNRRMRMVH